MTNNREHNNLKPFDYNGIISIHCDEGGCKGIDKYGKIYMLKYNDIVDIYSKDNRHVIGNFLGVDIVTSKNNQIELSINFCCENMFGNSVIQGFLIDTIDKWEILNENEVEEE